jgi:hypothetical protein
VNIKLGLMITGVADPRSKSGPHQLEDQSWGWKKEVAAPSVAAVRITESLLTAPEHGIAFPVAKKTLPVLSSTSTPPAAQTPSPVEGVS